MRKSFFLSILAVGALVAGCAKSEVVDTKFNEEIGFDAYLGRVAQTKASVETKETIGGIGVYGYYLGSAQWDVDITANLWTEVLPLVVNEQGVIADLEETNKRYWANPKDNYTFLAYAPFSKVTAPTTTSNPTVEFTVNPEIPEQVDLLYATPVSGTTEELNGTVALAMNHALSKINVKAKGNGTDFMFDVKAISLKGNFHPSGRLPLATGEWDKDAAAAAEYVFFNTGTDVEVEGKTETTYPVYSSTNALPTDGTYKNYAVRNDKEDNYLMIIPVEGEATLEVVYTTYYQNQESFPIAKSIPVTMNFAKGMAYTLNLDFYHETEEIKFTVSVAEWDEQDPTTSYPEDTPGQDDENSEENA